MQELVSTSYLATGSSWAEVVQVGGTQCCACVLNIKHLCCSRSVGALLSVCLSNSHWAHATIADRTKHTTQPYPLSASRHDPLLSLRATTTHTHAYTQVVDLLGELTARGLDPETAAAVLDSADLAIGLSFWVAAAPPSDSTHHPQQQLPYSNTPASATSSSTRSINSHSNPLPAAASASNNTPSGQQSPAQFAAALMLDGGQVPLRSFQTFVVNDSSHHFFSKRLAVDAADGWRRWVCLWCVVGCEGSSCAVFN